MRKQTRERCLKRRWLMKSHLLKPVLFLAERRLALGKVGVQLAGIEVAPTQGALGTPVLYVAELLPVWYPAQRRADFFRCPGPLCEHEGRFCSPQCSDDVASLAVASWSCPCSPSPLPPLRSLLRPSPARVAAFEPLSPLSEDSGEGKGRGRGRGDLFRGRQPSPGPLCSRQFANQPVSRNPDGTA